MFTAFTSGLRSADLSRQVGAVIAKDEEILSMGANECPRAQGGVYWPKVNYETWEVYDSERGRDYMRGEDSNAVEKAAIVNGILQAIGKLACFENLSEADWKKTRNAIQSSKLKDITEYGRVVHAEMDALLGCARNGISCRGATLYCTTFPCHNCAKHVIAAGIRRVVYVEPYPKSKAPEFHDEAINLGIRKSGSGDNLVHFQPFIGIGPRRFISLFSLKLGMGYPIDRKDFAGAKVDWEKNTAIPRLQMLPSSYTTHELAAMNDFKSVLGDCL